MKTVFSLFTLLIVSCSVYSQNYLTYNKYMDIPKPNYYSNVISCSDTSGNNTWVVLQIDSTSSKKYQHIMRLDIDGNVIFSKELYTQGYPYSIIATKDDGLLMVGSIQRGTKWVGWACKLNNLGESEWNYKYYNDSFYTYYRDVSVASNGDYILYGSQYGINKYKGNITRISNTGEIIWTKEYDNILSTESVRARKILTLENGNMYVSFNQGERVSYLIKIDANGDILYQNSYFFYTLNNFILYDIAKLSANRYVGFFSTTSLASMVIMDSNGVILRNYPVNRLYEKVVHIESNNYIYARPSFDYLFLSKVDTLGQVYSYIPNTSGDYSSLTMKNKKSALISYIKPVDKKVHFIKLNVIDISDTTCYGSVSSATSGLSIVDTNFTLNAASHVFFKESNPVTSKVISKDFTTICSKANTSIQNEIKQDNIIYLYPNPAQTHVYITLPTQNTDLRVWDIHGKLVYERKNLNTLHKIDIEHFSQGLYNVELQTNHQKQFQKFIKID